MGKNAIIRGLWMAGFSVLATNALAQSGQTIPGNDYNWGPGMMWGTGQWGGFGMVLGPIFMILILVGIVAGVVYVLRLASGSSQSVANNDPGGDRSIAILKERFARGEIDAKEFEEIKQRLRD